VTKTGFDFEWKGDGAVQIYVQLGEQVNKGFSKVVFVNPF